MPQLSYQAGAAAQQQLSDTYLGKTLLITGHKQWSDAQVIRAYRSQFVIEEIFHEMKDRHIGAWWPLHHWTDSKIQVHGLYCTLADAYLGGHLILKPLLTLPVCGALVAVLAAALFWTWLRWRQPVSARRRAVLILLRIGVAVAALLLVLRPEIAWEGRQEVRGSVAFLVDATRSMGITDVDSTHFAGELARREGERRASPPAKCDAITRTEAVRLAFLSAVKPYTELSNSCVLGAFAFGTDLAQINNLAPSPEDPRTDIGQALDALAARTGNRLVAAVVVSDGRVNLAGGPTPEEAAKVLAAHGVRVHTVGVGSTQPTDRLCDVAIRDLRAPGRVFAGNRAAVRGIVSAMGLAGRPVKLTLTVNGKPVEERVLTPKSNLLVEEVAFTPMLETPGLGGSAWRRRRFRANSTKATTGPRRPPASNRAAFGCSTWRARFGPKGSSWPGPSPTPRRSTWTAASSSARRPPWPRPPRRTWMDSTWSSSATCPRRRFRPR